MTDDAVNSVPVPRRGEFRSARVVMPQHLNQYGNLFGGYMLQVIDEVAFITCVRSFPARNFVTRALEEVAFTAPAHLGDIVETVAWIERVGRTSVRIHVQAFVDDVRQNNQRKSFDGAVVLVCVDGNGEATCIEGGSRLPPRKETGPC